MTRLLLVLVSWQDWALAWWSCRRGHCDMLVMTSTRVYLHCAVCGREGPGWDCRFTEQRGEMADVATD